MADVAFIAALAAFFAVAAALVRACDHIIGVDDAVVLAPVAAANTRDVAA